MNNWESFTIAELIKKNILEQPMDGNHGEIHPKGEDFVESGIPFIMASDIENSNINIRTCSFIKKEQADNLRKGFSITGDVLLTHKATIGRTAVVPDIDFPYLMLTPQVTYYRIKNKKKLNNRFLKYYFDTKVFQETIKNWAGAGSTRAYIGITQQQNLKIYLPDISTQQKIAKVLSSLDTKIELNNRINAELELLVKTIYDYWFVQFDFPNENGKPYKSSGGKMEYNKELKREIPEGWEIKSLNDISSFISRGISPQYIDEGGVCVINQKCIRNRTVLYHEARRNDNNKRNADAKRVLEYDILVNSTGVGTLGRVAIVNRLIEDFVTVDSHVTIVRPNNELINKFYYGFSLLEKQNEIERFALGSTGQVELSRSQLESLKILIPPKELQKKFEKVYKNSLDKMAVNSEENQQLASLRDWLLPMLMNGQVTVKDIEKEMNIAAEPKADYGK